MNNDTTNLNTFDGLMIENGILTSCTTRDTKITVPDGVHTIGEGAFKGCISLQEIFLPDTVRVLSDHAFKGCRRLRKVDLPKGLREIGNYAFHRCHSLSEIILPDTVTRLGNCVFLYCDSLETIEMPGVKSLGLQVFLNDVCLKRILISTELNISDICDCFTGCGRLTEISFSDGASYHMENPVSAIDPDVKAPDLAKAIAADICRMMELQDKTITRFLTNIKHVELAEGITCIGKSCFFDKKGVISVIFPSTLQEIGSRAFRNCINLERVEFSNNQVQIHKDAFKNCTTLHTIRLADGTEYELSGLACEEDEKLPSIVRDIHAQVLGNFSISETVLLKYRGSEERVVVPEGVTVIGERAFAENEAIDRVVLPETVQIIEEEAFSDCLMLQTINFPDGLREIGRSAFENCVKLIRAILPDTIKKVSPSVFNRCRVLNEVYLGSDVEEIGNLAFYGCTQLKKTALPQNLKKLGDMAFYRCLSLKEIVLPSSLKVIGSNVFTHSGIKNAVIFSDPITCGTDVFSQCERLKKLTFENGVCHIGDKFAFQCEKLSVVSLPETLKTMGRHVFWGSRYMAELPAVKTVQHIFLDGSSLSGHVILGEEIQSMAGGAFYGNTAITAITLPKSLSWIGPYAFSGCTNLKEIFLPSGIQCLDEGVFAGCTALRTVLTEAVDGQIKTVSARAFLNCCCLETIPSLEKCTRIGSHAFAGCKMLCQIHGFKDRMRLFIGDSAFRDTKFLRDQKMASIASNDGSVILSKTLVDGMDCKGEVRIAEGVTDIADYAFCGNEVITSVILPESLKTIGAFAFAGCKKLKLIYFSAPLDILGVSAFEKCIGLETVFCNVIKISYRAFAWCTSLKSIAFPSAISVNDSAFCGCWSLTDCYMEHICEIGREVFSGCRLLAHFSFQNTKSIGERAFERCDSFISIVLPSLAVVASHSFEDCGCLERIELLDECSQFGSYGFSGCTALRQVVLCGITYELDQYGDIFDRTLPDAVRQVYNSVLTCFTIDENLCLNEYRNCGRFVSIPNGIKQIGEEVFKDKTRLEKLFIPDTVEYIGPRAFDKTPWLEHRRSISKGLLVVINHILIDAGDSEGHVVIDSEIKLVSGWSFANCLDLTEITFTSMRTIVEPHAFRNCIQLKHIALADGSKYHLDSLDFLKQDLPPMVRQIALDSYNCFKTDEKGVLLECTGNISRLLLPKGISVIGPGALKESNLLTKIRMPEDVIAIEDCAFEQCKWLETVTGTSNLVHIGRMAFSGCVRLEKLESLSALRFVGERAFENCTCLKEIILPEGITEIPNRAFFRCHELRRVVLPSTLKKIGDEAFAFCYHLPDLVLPDGWEQVGNRAFAWCKTDEEVYEI